MDVNETNILYEVGNIARRSGLSPVEEWGMSDGGGGLHCINNLQTMLVGTCRS